MREVGQNVGKVVLFLAKIIRAVPKRSEGELQDVVGGEFMRLNEGNVSQFQKQKAS